ncbi:Acetyltransferase, GNAT family protein [Enhygromyxa salina]|uniref:Acetyltransferase, GNAT family protein n=1 Tax=Enhygromyxa salina TaxID=215803 RepID=A0A0C2D868_9BACT|nr:GNAT family N-acetyltransferase [Enhygromyxa salina]KIG19326.1 Acetyltransferase, GNAT family protein [Enhygromyxa salina]
MVELGAIELERVLVDALALSPDAVLIDRPDWVQLTTPSVPHPNRNGVFLARLEKDTADARIAEVKRAYLEHGAGMRWIVGPGSTPDDLSERLERAGIKRLAYALGLSMRVPARPPKLPEGLKLREVGAGDVEDYAEVNARAWERGPAFRRESEAFIVRALARDDDDLRSWLVYWHDALIGTATLRMLRGQGQDLGYLQGAAILREHRRQGIYQGLLDHRLGVLRAEGIDHVVVWADESTSAGVCQRAGFVPKCRAAFHELPEPPPPSTADSE